VANAALIHALRIAFPYKFLASVARRL
jgi:hypothetical protein